MEDVDTLKEKSGFSAADNIRYSVVDVLGLENVIDAVGLEKIVSSIGADNFVKVFGLDNFIKSIPPDRRGEVIKLINERKNQENNENP